MSNPLGINQYTKSGGKTKLKPSTVRLLKVSKNARDYSAKTRNELAQGLRNMRKAFGRHGDMFKKK